MGGLRIKGKDLLVDWLIKLIELIELIGWLGNQWRHSAQVKKQALSSHGGNGRLIGKTSYKTHYLDKSRGQKEADP